MNTDGSDGKTIVTDCHMPDDVVVDVDAGHIYWTDMGIPDNAGLGRIFRANGVRTKPRIIQRTYHCAYGAAQRGPLA